jgi:hypothetical protein
MAIDGSVQAGQQSLELTVGHLQESAGSAITGASVQVSTDDGVTWQDAQVTACGDGAFRATFTLSPVGPQTYVTLRVVATDAAGGGISETTLRAYRLQ